MARLYRTGIIGLSILVFCCTSGVAQTGDTVKIGEERSVSGSGTVGGSTDTAVTEEHPEPRVLRVLSDSILATWKSDKAFEYANDPEYWKKRDDEAKSSSDGWLTRLLASAIFGYFLLCLLAGVLIYAIVRIVLDNKLQLFYKSPKRVNSGDGSDASEAMQDDLEGQLMHFMQIKDYRQAVRFLYLKALRLLSDRGMIRYHRDGTNHEYREQLAATPQGRAFQDLTTIYEKVWYGEFPLGDPLFIRLHQYFEDFYKTVRA